MHSKERLEFSQRIIENPPATIPVEFLFKVTGQLGPATTIENGPQGTRLIFPVVGGHFEGPKLRGTVELPAGDWLTLRPDGSGKIDVRSTLKTEDGALILVSYTGIVLTSRHGSTLRIAPLFETGDVRYEWLNRVQAVGIGVSNSEQITYSVFALI
jgi:hypothetical protein